MTTSFGAKRAAPGAVPGTFAVDPEAPKSKVHVMAYGPQELIDEDVGDLDRIPDLLGKYAVTWVNVDGLGDGDVIASVGKMFGIHPLAVADVVNTHQRAKVEEYGNPETKGEAGEQLFVVVRMVSLGERLDSEQVSLFLGPGFVLTFQERPGDCLDPVRERIRVSKGMIRACGADFLAYALIDAVIDGYFPVLEQYGEVLHELEQEVTESPDEELVPRIHAVKQDLRMLRRAAWPQRELVAALMREATPIINDETKLFLRDCYDHSIQIMDLVESYREQGSDLVNLHMSVVSNNMNAIMKVLTIIATIFIPLGFIAGLYGMNFDPGASPWNMPELKWYFGYPMALAIMAAASAGMLVYFRVKRWL